MSKKRRAHIGQLKQRMWQGRPKRSFIQFLDADYDDACEAELLAEQVRSADQRVRWQ